MKIHDISVAIQPQMTTWPNHPTVQVEKYRALEKGDSTNSSKIALSVHTGTHLDAPYHFFGEGARLEELQLETLIGPVYVADFTHLEKPMTREDLEKHPLPFNTHRVLLKTRNSSLWKNSEHLFNPQYIAVETDAAEYFVEKKLWLVGIDYLSIQPFQSLKSQTHHVLLEAGIIILEGLDLYFIPEGEYELICLPLKLIGTDGAPTRAVLVER